MAADHLNSGPQILAGDCTYVQFVGEIGAICFSYGCDCASDAVMSALPVALDDLDRRLLIALLHNPVAPFSRIGAELEVSTATVSSRMRRLQRHGLVRIIGRTLPGFGGRHAYLIRVASAPDRIARLATTAAAYSNTRWVRISKSGAELMCGLLTEEPSRDPVLTRLPYEPQLHRVGVHELLHIWGSRTAPDARIAVTLDQLDQALLEQLALNGRAELSVLAQTLGVNASTVSRRRQRLVDAGVLYFEADVHPAALGGTGDAMLWMQVRPGSIRSAGAALREDHRVRFIAATSGTHDLVAHVQVVDNRALLDLVDDTFAPLGVTRVEQVPMGRVLKRNAV